jgi:hypothetical protein
MKVRSTLFTAAMVLMAAFMIEGCATPKVAGRPGLTGTIFAPADNAYLYVYKKGATPHGPAEVITPLSTLADGAFSVELPPGEYTVVARRRATNENGGPLVAGDRRSEPVDIKVGTDGKIVLNLVMNVKEDAEYKSSFIPPKEWTTAVAGTVRDSEGNPVQGTRVHAYTYVQMSERPKYVSERTGPDGKFVIFLPKGGTYYLAARDRFGGPPRIGDLYGRYDEGSINPTGVVLKDGERKEGIDIMVFRVW